MFDLDTRASRAATVRVMGNIALAAGLLIAGIGLLSDAEPSEGHLLAGMLVATGIGLRLEAAVADRHDGPEDDL